MNYNHTTKQQKIRTCGFFRWADEVDDVLELQNRCFEKDTIVAELEMQNEELARTVKEQKQEIKQLTDERDELAMEVSETILSISSAKADRKFAMALILSWVFFSFALLIK